MKTKFFCVHGHFYQPPRVNPWTGTENHEESAYPFRNWNHRISHECYLPNAFSQIRKGKSSADEFMNNYSMISFDFAPTLADWAEKYAPRLYNAVKAADAESEKIHGKPSALAHPYSHIILPLAPLEDKKLQVTWGLEHFRNCFGREAEGIWLPETAVDEETLEVLCLKGLRFTLLSEEQARSFRKIGSDKWEPANEISFDASIPYRWFSKANPGRHIDIFFFSRKLSRSITDGMRNTESFHDLIISAMPRDKRRRLISIASDGENYGHHMKGGAAALTSLLLRIRKERKLTPGNFSSFLERNAPEFEVEISSPSSWSCRHGVSRWKENCGCRMNPRMKNQEWRRTLREAVDRLSSRLDEIYREKSGAYFKKPRAALEKYIPIFYEQPFEKKKSLDQAAGKHLHPHETRNALRLLETQRLKALAMTSCAWFFDDITDIPALNSVKFALRAAETAGSFSGELVGEFIEKISRAESNFPERKMGEIAAKFFRERENEEKTALDFAVRLSFSFTPPFYDWGNCHAKILDYAEHGFVKVFFIRTHTSDTLDEAHFTAAALNRKTQDPVFFIAKCDRDGDLFRKISNISIGDDFEKKAENEGLRRIPFDSLPENTARICALLMHSFPESEPASTLRKWLNALRNFTPEDFHSRDVFAILSEFEEKKIKPADIPFFNETAKAMLSHFEFLLETEKPEIKDMLPWIRHFSKIKTHYGLLLKVKGIIYSWAKTRAGSVGSADFRKALEEIAETAGLKIRIEAKPTDGAGRGNRHHRYGTKTWK